VVSSEESTGNVRSKIRWLTEFCNSHYVSHFAAFFIVARAKISVVESCLWLTSQGCPHAKLLQGRGLAGLRLQPAARPRGGQEDRRIQTTAGRGPLVLCEWIDRFQWSLRRFTYGDLVTTSPSSKREGSTKFPKQWAGDRPKVPVLTLHQHVQSVGATGGVYKGQGRNQREMMTRAY